MQLLPETVQLPVTVIEANESGGQDGVKDNTKESLDTRVSKLTIPEEDNEAFVEKRMPEATGSETIVHSPAQSRKRQEAERYSREATSTLAAIMSGDKSRSDIPEQISNPYYKATTMADLNGMAISIRSAITTWQDARLAAKESRGGRVKIIAEKWFKTAVSFEKIGSKANVCTTP